MKIKFRTKDLSKDQVCGWCYRSKRLIEIDQNEAGLSRLDTIVHEILHLIKPYWSEKRVTRWAGIVSQGLWRLGYRRKSELGLKVAKAKSRKHRVTLKKR